jgi:hypothetical protein
VTVNRPVDQTSATTPTELRFLAAVEREIAALGPEPSRSPRPGKQPQGEPRRSKPRRRRWRGFVLLLAVLAVGGLTLAYGPTISRLRGATGMKMSISEERTAPANPEVERLKDELRRSDLSIQKLEEENASLREKLAAESAPRGWYNDSDMLSYRNPWDARSR